MLYIIAIILGFWNTPPSSQVSAAVLFGSFGSALLIFFHPSLGIGSNIRAQTQWRFSVPGLRSRSSSLLHLVHQLTCCPFLMICNFCSIFYRSLLVLLLLFCLRCEVRVIFTLEAAHGCLPVAYFFAVFISPPIVA